MIQFPTMSKETFIIKTEWYKAISKLNPIDQATIFRNLFAYHIDEDAILELDNLTVSIVWDLIEGTLSRNMDAYDRKLHTNRENGKLGGRPSTKPKTETQINPNNQTVITPITQTSYCLDDDLDGFKSELAERLDITYDRTDREEPYQEYLKTESGVYA